MTQKIFQLDPFDCHFPSAEYASEDPDGLLAFGGDLSHKRLLQAYHNGIFPWYNSGEPILWWSPKFRGILQFDDFIINRSLRKFLNKLPYTISVNRAFEQVIKHCSKVKRKGAAGTWITPQMTMAYIKMHQLGHAHSIEVWQQDTLVGGLYGINVGSCFCGESMFHLAPNASKVAYWALVRLLQSNGGAFIDCQMQNDFLQTLGVSEISRELYLEMLATARQQLLDPAIWSPRYVDVADLV